MKARILTVTLCAVLTGFSATFFAAETVIKSGPSSQLSPGLDDVVKLSKAGVSESIILTYVQSSGVMYSPSAQELIQLNEAGVSPQVTTALLQRGSEVRQIALQSQQQAQAAAQANAQRASVRPTTTYVSTPSGSTTPAASGSTVTYIGAPTFFTYPVSSYYAYNGCYYPRYYNCGYPSVVGGARFGHHNGFRGGVGFVF